MPSERVLDLLPLSAEQAAAVDARGTVLVSAAAGSGKTRVLTARVLSAVLDDKIAVESIVAVTFTQKAAAELRSRVAELLVRAGEHELVARLEHARFGTIHSLCARVLRDFAWHGRIDPRFTVLDDAQARYLRHGALKQVFDDCERDDDIMGLRVRYSDDGIAKIVTRTAQYAARRVDGSVTFDPALHDSASRHDVALLARIVDGWRETYQTLLEEHNALDFDGLEHHTNALLGNSDVRRAIHATTSRVLVDEFQDTNEVQCAILNQIAGDELFMVGDEWQSIYAFRGADVQVFRDTVARIDGPPLVENYRSRPQVITAVNAMFGNLFGAEFRPVTAQRDAPHDHRWNNRVLLVEHDGKGEDGLSRAEHEAAIIARDVAQRVADGVDAGSIALLFPRMSNADAFEQALREWGLPTLRVSSGRFYDLQQVNDALAVLAWARNRFDERAALTSLASPYGGCRKAELAELRLAAGDNNLYAAITASSNPNVIRAREIRLAVESILRNGSLVDAVEYLIAGTGIEYAVLAMPDGDRRYANMLKLVRLAHDAMHVGVNDVAGFLSMIDAQRRLDASPGEASIADENTGAVRLMTVHASKGLEFDHVYVCDLANDGNRTAEPALVTSGGGIIVRTWTRAGDDRLVSDAWTERSAVDTAAREKEEQRLLYVATTRAREAFTLTGAYRVTKKDGTATRNGFLGHVYDALDFDPAQRVPDRSDIAVEIVLISEPAPSADPGRYWHPPALDIPPPFIAPAATITNVEEPDTYERKRVADRMAAREGERQHARIANMLRLARAGRFAADEAPADLIALARSDVFAELVAAQARPEVPFHMATDEGMVTGRFDALVRSDIQWWIADFKAHLPADDDEAWALHEEQLERYVRAARSSGAQDVRVTLIDVAHPARIVERMFTPANVSSA